MAFLCPRGSGGEHGLASWGSGVCIERDRIRAGAVLPAARDRAGPADARGAREPAARIEPFRRPGPSGRAEPACGAGLRQSGRRDESGRARRAAGRREDVHHLPSARERALHAHAALARPARGEQGRCEHSGLRDLPRTGFLARAEPDREGTHHRLHEEFGHADRDADEDLPDLPSGWSARSLDRLGASAQRIVVQRLPQPDGEVLGRGAAREGVDQRHLRAMPQGRAHAVQPALAHAAAGRPDELRRLPQPARLADQSAARRRTPSTRPATSATPRSAARSCSSIRRCARTVSTATRRTARTRLRCWSRRFRSCASSATARRGIRTICRRRSRLRAARTRTNV